jgi:hypothetical protein
MQRASDKGIGRPLSERYLDIIARNPALFKGLANRKAEFWYPAPNEIKDFYEKNKKILDHPDLDDD